MEATFYPDTNGKQGFPAGDPRDPVFARKTETYNNISVGLLNAAVDESVYEMTVAKNGPKVRESTPKEAPKQDGPPGQLQRDRDGFPILTGGMSMAIMSDHARLRSDNQPMAWLVRMLAGQLQSPVIDATGLTGKYDFVLSWSIEEDNASGVSIGEAFRSALISALPSQLGLKLEQKKGQVEVMVIDHLEKAPTAN